MREDEEDSSERDALRLHDDDIACIIRERNDRGYEKGERRCSGALAVRRYFRTTSAAHERREKDFVLVSTSLGEDAGSDDKLSHTERMLGKFEPSSRNR